MYVYVYVQVYVCVFIKLNITAQSGPVILVILIYCMLPTWELVCLCVCMSYSSHSRLLILYLVPQGVLRDQCVRVGFFCAIRFGARHEQEYYEVTNLDSLYSTRTGTSSSVFIFFFLARVNASSQIAPLSVKGERFHSAKEGRKIHSLTNICVVIIYSRVWINRVRLPILHVAS